MRKRGQVSVFMIVGIAAVAAIVLVFLLFRSVEEKARDVRSTEEYLSSQLGDLKKQVSNCIGEVADDALDRLYAGGGDLNPERYANYRGNNINVLCYKAGDGSCYNFMFVKSEIIEQLLPFLEQEIKSCVDSKLVFFEDQDYTVEGGEFSLDDEGFVFDDERLLVTIDYPITLIKGNDEQAEERFVAAVDTDFWQIAEIVNEIINTHARGDDIDLISLSLKNIFFEIDRTLYKDGSIYMIRSRYGDERIFYFAVET